MGDNSAPLKENCTLFAPTSYFRACAVQWCHLNFSPANPRCHGNEFWDKIDYNSVCVKDIRKIFASIRGFWGWAIECCQPNFFPSDPLYHGNEIWDIMGENSAYVRDICEIFASVGGEGFGDGPSNAANRIFLRPALVAMATKFGTQLSITRSV